MYLSTYLSPSSVLPPGFPGGSSGKESAYNVGDLGWEDPLEGGNGYPLLYSGLENSKGSQRVRHN